MCSEMFKIMRIEDYFEYYKLVVDIVNFFKVLSSLLIIICTEIKYFI